MPTFPVDINTYFADVGALKVNERLFNLSDPRSYNETKAGEAIITSYGTPLWYGSVTVVPLHHALQRPLEARARALQNGGASFYIGDLMEDPWSAYGSPTISGVNYTLNTIALAGMTASRLIPTGTRIAWEFSGRRTLHETQVNRTSNASGDVGGLEVWPPIPAGTTNGTAVTLGGAAKCKAHMLPGTFKAGRADAVLSDGFTFNWRQTLR